MVSIYYFTYILIFNQNVMLKVIFVFFLFLFLFLFLLFLLLLFLLLFLFLFLIFLLLLLLFSFFILTFVFCSTIEFRFFLCFRLFVNQKYYQIVKNVLPEFPSINSFFFSVFKDKLLGPLEKRTLTRFVRYSYSYNFNGSPL